jgi:putative flavoprotein involved in K+ transport
MPRLTAFDRDTAIFSDSHMRDVGSVVWAAGYHDETTWVRIVDAVDGSGSFVQTRGASPVPGLFFVGRPWQMTQSSGLVTGVGADAQAIVTRLVASLTTQS